MTIRFGTVPAGPAASAGRSVPWVSTPDTFRLNVDGVARYLVREGREIVVEPVGGGEADVSTFLLGPAMAACLQQRGIATLHASAVEIGAGAVLFAGDSGIGKSTLVAALVERGHRLMADDFSALHLGAGDCPEVLPAFACVRLWANAVEALGWERRTQVRVRDRMEKDYVPVDRYRPTPLRVHAVFAMQCHNRKRFDVETVPTARAFEWLLWSTYGARLVHTPDVHRNHFRTVAALAKRVPFMRIARPARPVCPGALADCIVRNLDAKPPAAPAPGREVAGPGEARAVALPAPDRGPREASVVWLASYPKSGNTWLRALLTNYLRDSGGPASINALVGSMDANSRRLFARYAGVPSSDLSPAEVLRLRPAFHEWLAAELPRPAFVKVHDACEQTAVGPLFPRAATAGVVYLVRNPCDVAVSFAHHLQWSIGRVVAEMNRPKTTLLSSRRGIHWTLPQAYSTWSAHVTSWLESDLPLHLVRYEDMLADPRAAFGAVLRFVGVDPDPARLANAVELSRFGRLRAQEEREGFRERQPSAPSFFRSGTAGGWRAVLAPEQVRALVEAHAPVMARLGYLRAAESFLRDAGETSCGARATD